LKGSGWGRRNNGKRGRKEDGGKRGMEDKVGPQ